MHCEKLNLKDTHVFSDLFLNYISQDSTLNAFMNVPPSLKSIHELIEHRNFNQEKRQLLIESIMKQYSGINQSDVLQLNIKSLKNGNTYTVTTGHQLNIFTGPLYFIYKILTVINTCEVLNARYPDHHFVPVYWMASEDHDLEEISSFNLFGKRFTWETDQKGPVGRMDPSGLKKILNEIPEKITIFEEGYLNHADLAGATRYFVNELFGNYGLVVIDADEITLKTQIKDIIKDDLLDHHANDLVEAASAKLSEKGFKTQVYPRAINLFYMSDGIRNRIIKEGGYYKVLDSDLQFTEKEILEELERNPQNFSPNVILRPLYQEIILPNIIYIGGPAEVAYWLQLKDMFDYFKVPFPMILPRNFILYLNKTHTKKLKKLMIPPQDIFKSVTDLRNQYIEEHTAYTINLHSENHILSELFDSIRNKSRAVDPSLEGFVESERVKTEKSLENIEKRFKKSEEQKQEIELRQIDSLKEKLFPNNSLQERFDNFLNFYLNNPDFLNEIKGCIDPFDFRFNIILEE